MDHGQQDISRKAAVSMFSGMAYKSITTTGESMEPTTSAWPTAIEEYVRGRAFFPVPCLIRPSAWKVDSQNSICRSVHRAPILRRIRPLLTLRTEKADHYMLRVRIKMRLCQYAAPHKHANRGEG